MYSDYPHFSHFLDEALHMSERGEQNACSQAAADVGFEARQLISVFLSKLDLKVLRNMLSNACSWNLATPHLVICCGKGSISKHYLNDEINRAQIVSNRYRMQV
jgi:hypothetical protein